MSGGVLFCTLTRNRSSATKHMSLFQHLASAAHLVDLREETSRCAFGPFDFVKRSKERHPPARQRSQVRDPFHDHDSGAKNHAVHREIFGSKVGEPCAVLLEEIEPNRLEVLGTKPLSGLRREERRLGEVVGPLAVHFISPTGAKKNDVALLHLIGSAALEIVDGNFMVGINKREIDSDRLADDLI